MQTSTAPEQPIVIDAPAGASAGESAEAARRDPLAADLYALHAFLNKSCNSNVFEAMGVLELTITQFKLLHALELADGPVTVKRAGELLGLSLPAASRAVDDLVRRGMIERHEDHEDRRMKRISLTSGGRSVISRVNAARLAGLEQFTLSLTKTERDRLASALGILLRRGPVAACRPEGDRQP